MLELQVVLKEAFNEEENSFVVLEELKVQLEHSLVSLSKWESHFEKPFFAKEDMSMDETLWYIRAMLLTPNVSQVEFNLMLEQHSDTIKNYISAKQTATFFNTPEDNRPSREIITSEIIYYWMVSMQIPFECQEWHINRLLTLIKVINKKNAPAKKMSKSDILRRNRDLNAQRRAALNTTG